MKTPREFWIINNKGSENYHTIQEKEPNMDGFENIMEVSRFIEYSAYEALKEKYDNLVSYLPKVPTEPYEKELAKEALKLKKQNEILVDGFEQINNATDCELALEIYDETMVKINKPRGENA